MFKRDREAKRRGRESEREKSRNVLSMSGVVDDYRSIFDLPVSKCVCCVCLFVLCVIWTYFGR